MKNDSFRSRENEENLLGYDVLYLSPIDALMYLANCTVKILLFINLLAKYNSTQTQRHCNDIKNLMCYLHGTINMSLFYSNESKS